MASYCRNNGRYDIIHVMENLCKDLAAGKFPRLSTPPVVEAVFCVDFAGFRQITKESALGLMSAVSSEYVYSGDMVSRAMTFDIKAMERPVLPVTLWEGAKFIKNKSNVIVLTNLDAQVVRFSYGRLEPYESWEKFIDEGRHVLDAFVSAQTINPIVKRVGVRFINRIFPSKPQCPITDILYSVPPDPRNVAGISSCDFFYKDTSYYADFDLNATSVRATQRNVGKGVSIVVDTDVFVMPDKEYSLMEWESLLGCVRKLKNALFFGSVSEKFIAERL